MGQFKAYESLLILNGTLAPPAVLDSNNNELIKPTFRALVTQIALEKALDIYTTQPSINLGTNPTPEEEAIFLNAKNYLTKILKTADNVINNDPATFGRLVKIVITQFSANYSYNVFVNATAQKNINFWENKITDVMQSAIEFLAGISPDQKAAYNSFKI